MTSSGKCSTCDTALPPYRGKGRSRLYCSVACGDAAYRARRRALIAAAKAQPCADCDVEFPAVCMEFDHVRGTKEFGINTGRRYSLARLTEEIAKCDIRCSNCHRLRHWLENAKPDDD